MSLNTARIASVMLFASLMFAPAAMVAAPAIASDDDVICFDYPLPGGGEETECGTVGDYKAECKLTDPDSESEFCQDVNSQLRQIAHAALIAASQDDGGTGGSSQKIKVPTTRQ